MQNTLNLSYARKYILTTLPVNHIQKFAADAIKDFALALSALVVALLQILYCVILVLAKLSILAFPHAVKLFHNIVKFHRTQLSWTDIAIEMTALTLIVLYFVFRKKIAELWRRVDRYISAKSKAAAAAAPHVLFFTTALVFAVLGKKFILPFTSSAIMPVFTLLIPVTRTSHFARVMYNDRSFNVNKKKYLPVLSQHLTLWIVLATYHALVTVFEQVPFSTRLLMYLPYMKELLIVVLIWTQLSPVFTKIVYKSAITPVIKQLSRYIPTAQFDNAPDNRRHYLIMMLKMTKVLQDHHLDFIGKLLEDSVVTIMAAIFILLPNPFATMGMVTITCLLPAFRAVTITEAFKIRGVGEANVDPIVPPFLMEKAITWLYYWIAFAWLWLIRIYVVKLWPSVTIGIGLYLQHIFFAGAKVVVSGSLEIVNVVIYRNQSVETRRMIEESRTTTPDNLSAPGEVVAVAVDHTITSIDQDNQDTQILAQVVETVDDPDYVRIDGDTVTADPTVRRRSRH